MKFFKKIDFWPNPKIFENFEIFEIFCVFLLGNHPNKEISYFQGLLIPLFPPDPLSVPTVNTWGKFV